MKHPIRHWWPALPALVILGLGGRSFLEKYPHPVERKSSRFAGSTGGPDSLLAYIRRSQAGQANAEGDSAGAGTKPALDASASPFRPMRAPHAERAGQARAVPLAPPPRRYVLKGTVGNEVATISGNGGQRQIVKAGDRIDSAEVISIEANKVVLKDRAGRFELFIEK